MEKISLCECGEYGETVFNEIQKNFFVVCKRITCGCSTPRADTKEDAIKKWNKMQFVFNNFLELIETTPELLSRIQNGCPKCQSLSHVAENCILRCGTCDHKQTYSMGNHVYITVEQYKKLLGIK